MNPHINRAVFVFGNGKEFDRVAELTGKQDVSLTEVADAFGVDLRKRHAHAKSQHRQQGQLVSRVDAVDVKAGVSLGESLFLSAPQDGSKLFALFSHFREDIITSAIDDTEQRPVAISRQSLTQGANDG